MALQPILFFGLFAIAGYAQSAAVSGEDALQSFASRPTAQTVWSQEIERIDANGVQAVITAIEMTDSAQRPSSIRGVRIDLTDANGQAHVYVSEEKLPANAQVLGEIAAGSPQFLARHPTGEHTRCFGSGYFWTRPHEAFAVSECQTVNSRFLAVRGVGIIGLTVLIRRRLPPL